MKKFLILGILFLIFSCTAKKTVTKSDVIQKNDIATTIENRVSKIDNSTQKVDENTVSGTETTITTILYDTEKPIEEKTGKPPIKSETVKVIKKDISQKTAVLSDFTTIYNDSTRKITVDKSKIETKTEVRVTPKKSTFAYIYYILVIVIVIVAGYFVYAKFGSIKSLFGIK